MVDDAFYLVWKSGGDCPTKRYMEIENAREEARRLAQENHCIEFFVLRVLEGVTYNESPFRCRNFKHSNKTATKPPHATKGECKQ